MLLNSAPSYDFAGYGWARNYSLRQKFFHLPGTVCESYSQSFASFLAASVFLWLTEFFVIFQQKSAAWTLVFADVAALLGRF